MNNCLSKSIRMSYLTKNNHKTIAKIMVFEKIMKISRTIKVNRRSDVRTTINKRSRKQTWAFSWRELKLLIWRAYSWLNFKHSEQNYTFYIKYRILTILIVKLQRRNFNCYTILTFLCKENSLIFSSSTHILSKVSSICTFWWAQLIWRMIFQTERFFFKLC